MYFHRTIALCFCLLGGCVSPAPETALSVVNKVVGDLRAGDTDAASSLLTSEARARAAAWPKLGTSSVVSRETRRDASWAAGREAEVRLTYDERGWRIASGVLRFLDASTLSNAMRKLSRSVLGADYELLVELLPADDRKAWGPAQLMRKLENEQVKQSWRSLAKAIERGGYTQSCVDRTAECSVKVDVGVTLFLRREGEGWKVVDIQPYDKYIPQPSSRKADH